MCHATEQLVLCLCLFSDPLDLLTVSVSHVTTCSYCKRKCALPYPHVVRLLDCRLVFCKQLLQRELMQSLVVSEQHIRCILLKMSQYWKNSSAMKKSAEVSTFSSQCG